MLIENIYAQAQRTPDRIAVVHNNRPISYRAFARGVDAARRYLAGQELPATGIAVLAGGSILDGYVLGLAVRSLGMTTLLVPSMYHIRRLGRSEAHCVITTDAETWPGLHELCTASATRLITISAAIYADTGAGAAPALPELPASEGGHILLTSGTTGSHKKVLIGPSTQSQLCNFHQRVYGISEQSVVNLLHFVSGNGLGFKFSLTTWSCGGTVIFYQRSMLHQVFDYPKITHSFLSPQALGTILSAPSGELHRHELMQLVVTAGPLPRALADEARARLTPRIYTHYASTEGGPVTLTRIEQPEDLRWHRILPSCEVQIVDDSGHLLPAGQEGLVRVRPMAGVTGYLDDADASRTFFRGGYFYPGDLGIISPDGRLALQGRVTEVINISGIKVPAGPIEETLQAKFGASGACVFSTSRADGEEILHVVFESPQRFEPAEVVAVLRGLLPGTCRGRTHYVDDLPRNDMGKIRRDVLKAQLAGKLE